MAGARARQERERSRRLLLVALAGAAAVVASCAVSFPEVDYGVDSSPGAAGGASSVGATRAMSSASATGPATTATTTTTTTHGGGGASSTTTGMGGEATTVASSSGVGGGSPMSSSGVGSGAGPTSSSGVGVGSGGAPATSSSSGNGGAGAACGNGAIDPGEECDHAGDYGTGDCHEDCDLVGNARSCMLANTVPNIAMTRGQTVLIAGDTTTATANEATYTNKPGSDTKFCGGVDANDLKYRVTLDGTGTTFSAAIVSSTFARQPQGTREPAVLDLHAMCPFNGDPLACCAAPVGSGACSIPSAPLGQLGDDFFVFVDGQTYAVGSFVIELSYQ